MSRLIRVIFILNYDFWFMFFLWSFILFIGYNGLLNLFEFSCQVGSDLKIERVRNIYIIDYSYSNGVEKFYSTERVSNNFFNENIKDQKHFEICYNSKFPRLSYINNSDLSIYRNKASMVIALIFITFFLIIDLIVNKSFWITKYEMFFRKT